MNIKTAATESLIERWTELMENAHALEQTTNGLNVARGIRRYADEVAVELDARSWFAPRPVSST